MAVVKLWASAAALLPGFFTSEIEIGSLTLRSEQLFLAYSVVAMVVLGVGGAFEARKRIAEAFRGRRRGVFIYIGLTYIVLFWAMYMAICGLVLWHLLRVLIT
jgi:predicted small integral membrane protein